MWVWTIISGVIKVVTFVLKIAALVAAWAATNAALAAATMVGLWTVSRWARSQQWVGASAVASLAEGLGFALGTAAMVAWFTRAVFVAAPSVAYTWVTAKAEYYWHAFKALAYMSEWVWWEDHW